VSNDRSALDLRSPTAYGHAFADVYDGWYHDVSDSRAAARFIAKRCTPSAAPSDQHLEVQRPSVVEFGVGTGRLAGPMEDAGLNVLGIDASKPMLLGYLKSDQPQATGLALADMRAIPFRSNPESPFAAAVIAFNTLFNVADDDGQRDVLAEAHRLVADRGVVVVEALTVDDLPSEPVQSIGVRTVEANEVTVSATQIRSDQTMTGQHLVLSDDGVTIRPWMLRWLTTYQLDGLATSVGLKLVERFSSWDEQLYDETSSTHISVYRPR